MDLLLLLGWTVQLAWRVPMKNIKAGTIVRGPQWPELGMKITCRIQSHMAPP
jgi:hypothetical protein